MKSEVERGWWKTLFDEIYLVTDARSVCDERITRREIDLIGQLVALRPTHRILDLCGGHGRHSLELCARGFTDCTLLDYSPCLVARAIQDAVRCGYPLKVVRADARAAGLKYGGFDRVLILGNSMGYLSEKDSDLGILDEARRLLRSGGRLLVDVTDGEAAKTSFLKKAWHEIGDDIVVCRHRKLRDNAICAREMVISKQRGLIRDRNYAIRIYDKNTLSELLKKAGFENVKIHTDFSFHGNQGDYGFMNTRMIALGQKP